MTDRTRRPVIYWPRDRRVRARALLVLLAVVTTVALVGVRWWVSNSARRSVARAYAEHRATLDSISGEEIATQIGTLSSPEYEGRLAGSAGGRKAAAYIAGELAAMGVQPLIGDSYFQEFTIAYSHPVDEPQVTLYDRQDRAVGLLKYGEDIAYSLWSDSAAVERAPIVFVGGWDNIPAAGDLNGAVVLALRPPAQAGLALSSLYDALELAHNAGAVALLAADFDRTTLTSLWDVDTHVPGIALLGLGGPAADRLLRLTGRDSAGWEAELAAAAKDRRVVQPVDTGLKISLRWTIANDDRRSARNVVGVIPGRAGLANGRCLLLTAHYDHLGAVPGGPVWPGAWDNASGVSVMLAAARALVAARPELTVIVAAWDAEERGLVGSAYFAANLPVPADRISAVLNLDCVGTRPAIRLERSRVGPLTRFLRSAAARFAIAVEEATVQPWSDAASFTHLPGIEAIQIFDAGDPYQVSFLHAPSDTVANLSPEALARLARTVVCAIVAQDGGQGVR